MASKKTTSTRSSVSRTKRTKETSTKSRPAPLPARQEKPVITSTTWITLAVLVLVAGSVFLFNQQKAKQQATATLTPGGPAMLFPPGEGQLNDINIESSNGPSVEVARNSSGTWVLKAPKQADADQASAEAAASQISALNTVGDVQLAPDIVGLDKPAYTITLTFSAGKTHKLLVGSVNPIQTGYYSQLDGGKMQIVDKQGLDALLTMVTNPPYVATATPAETATPDATPTAAIPATATSSTPSGTQAAPSVTPTP